jgi:hypothetical protein
LWAEQRPLKQKFFASHIARGEKPMRRMAGPILCAALLIGCSSATPNFVKLDMSGKKDLSANNETLKRDIADCKVLEAHVREEGSLIFNTSTVRAAFDNCMRYKGYVKS